MRPPDMQIPAGPGRACEKVCKLGSTFCFEDSAHALHMQACEGGT